jgi:hypothetical protein
MDRAREHGTFTHVGTATDLALVLGTRRINPAAEFEKT